MLRSMTGFARSETQASWGHIICEIRSVNSRYLEQHFRLPEMLRSIEPSLREAVKKKLARGKIEISLVLKSDEQSGTLELNEVLASELIEIAGRVGKLSEKSAPINTFEIMRWPGVLQSDKVDQEQLESAAQSVFSEALNQLLGHREREGAELKSLIQQRLEKVAEQIEEVRTSLPAIQSAHQEKLRTRMETLANEVDQDRLAQELAIMAQKADVAEELDRTDAHILEIQKALKSKDPVGRRLDFLMQELNREANTLSSKSNASQTSQSAVDLKVYIEQMREQVQNIE